MWECLTTGSSMCAQQQVRCDTEVHSHTEKYINHEIDRIRTLTSRAAHRKTYFY